MVNERMNNEGMKEYLAEIVQILKKEKLRARCCYSFIFFIHSFLHFS